MDLINHYEEFADSQNLDKKQGIFAKLGDLDKIKYEFL